MEHDTAQSEMVPSGAKRRRWPARVAAAAVVALAAAGAWQLVQLHHEVDTQQAELRTLSGGASSKASVSSLGQMETRISDLEDMVGSLQDDTSSLDSQASDFKDQISRIEAYTGTLAVRIGCLNQALRGATVQSDGSLFVGVSC